MTLLKTPLHQKALETGARMVEFAGWEMPVQFSSLLEEHKSVRNKAGIFDISHMGIFLIEGERAKNALQYLVPSDLYRIGPGEACYTVLLNNKAGIIDDLIIYDLGRKEKNKESLLVVVNASRTKDDLEWLEKHLYKKNISINDAKKDQIFIAVQGPESIKILEKITNQTLTNIPNFGHRNIQLTTGNNKSDQNIFISRTGYTGEEGFELLLPSSSGSDLWDRLIEEGVQPCGLGARDTLRLEASMHLYGHELNMSTSPLEAGLGWLVHLEMKADFIGREILEEQGKEGLDRRLVGIKLEGRGIARQGYKVRSKGQLVGEITSGSWSPSLQEAIAFAYVPTKISKVGTSLEIEIRGKEYQAKIVKRPFYRRARIN